MNLRVVDQATWSTWYEAAAALWLWLVIRL